MIITLRQALARFLFALGRRVNVAREYTYRVELTADATAFVEGMTRAAAATARFHGGGIVRSPELDTGRVRLLPGCAPPRDAPRVDEITDGVPLVEFLDRGPK